MSTSQNAAMDGQYLVPDQAGRLRPCRLDPPGGVPEAALTPLAALLAAVLPDGAAPVVAGLLLRDLGSLGAVVCTDEVRLLAVPGMTLKAARLLDAARAVAAHVQRERVERDVINSWEALERWLKTELACRPKERVLGLFLDRKNALIRDEVLGDGTVDHVPLYPREVAARALLLNASAVILVHNHPSGDPTPSPADKDMSRLVAAALSTLGVAFHDHLIVSRGRIVSMRTERLL